MALALWLKKHRFRADQVQTFYPSPMALATAMYYSERNPLEKVRYKSERLSVCKDLDQRRLQKAFLRYHDEKNWPILRAALTRLGRQDLIGSGSNCLVPAAAANHQRSTAKNRRAGTGNARHRRR